MKQICERRENLDERWGLFSERRKFYCSLILQFKIFN